MALDRWRPFKLADSQLGSLSNFKTRPADSLFFPTAFADFFFDVEFLLLGQRLRVVVDWEKEESSAHTRYSFFLKPSVSPISSTDMASQSASRHRRCFDTRETQQGGSPGAEDLEAAPPKKKTQNKTKPSKSTVTYSWTWKNSSVESPVAAGTRGIRTIHPKPIESKSDSDEIRAGNEPLTRSGCCCHEETDENGNSFGLARSQSVSRTGNRMATSRAGSSRNGGRLPRRPSLLLFRALEVEVSISRRTCGPSVRRLLSASLVDGGRRIFLFCTSKRAKELYAPLHRTLW